MSSQPVFDDASLTRIGAPDDSVVNDPSGFAHVVVESVNSDRTSILWSLARASTCADTGSGAVNVEAAAGCAPTGAGLEVGSETANAGPLTPSVRVKVAVTAKATPAVQRAERRPTKRSGTRTSQTSHNSGIAKTASHPNATCPARDRKLSGDLQHRKSSFRRTSRLSTPAGRRAVGRVTARMATLLP